MTDGAQHPRGAATFPYVCWAYDPDEAVDGMRAVARHFRHHARPWERL